MEQYVKQDNFYDFVNELMESQKLVDFIYKLKEVASIVVIGNIFSVASNFQCADEKTISFHFLEGKIINNELLSKIKSGGYDKNIQDFNSLIKLIDDIPNIAMKFHKSIPFLIFQ